MRAPLNAGVLRCIPEYGCSSTGRVVVSKTIGCGFESYHPCEIQ